MIPLLALLGLLGLVGLSGGIWAWAKGKSDPGYKAKLPWMIGAIVLLCFLIAIIWMLVIRPKSAGLVAVATGGG